MKKALFATTALVLTAGVAAAEVTVGGDGRMGVIYDGADWNFTSRIRIKFTASGETDGGLQFGGSARVDHYDTTTGSPASAANGAAGSVYISGAFGKLSMGDVDGAAKAATGDVSGVGLTGLSDLNELQYMAEGGTDFQAGAGFTGEPSALYEYSMGDLSFYASATNPTGDVDAYSLAGAYAMGNFTVSLGYERAELDLVGANIDHYVLGASANFGPATVKAIATQVDVDTLGTFNQYALSVDYAVNALTVTAYYKDNSELNGTPLGGTEAYGIGASYDLGGGASLKGGYVSDQTNDNEIADFGISFTF
ncbi:porin [Ostreiculturibacter nitratireducens]|uniref:porin n=1 Tax=Ostreiculturibacter nitratireducens TaxID=3075226 RepID=UPI0031B5A351